jgi:hypothetical protein
MKKKTLVLTAALSLSLSIGTTAFAAPVAVGDSGVFDADYYADNNQDVEAAYGRDFNLLWQHYTTFGVNEGRLPFAPNTDWQAVLATANTTTTNTEATEQTQTQTEQTQTTVTPTVSTSDFLAQNGLSVTSQGVVPITYVHTYENYEPQALATTVSVKDVASSEAGYTDTIAEFLYQGNVVDRSYVIIDGWNLTVFDKASGQVMGIYEPTGGMKDDDDIGEIQWLYEKEGLASQYGCTITVDNYIRYNNTPGGVYVKVTVHHPTSYDGTAFMFGAGGLDGKAEMDAVAGNSFTILNTPYALSNAKIFTATNN